MKQPVSDFLIDSQGTSERVQQLTTVYNDRIKSLYKKIEEVIEQLSTAEQPISKEWIRDFIDKSLELERSQYLEITMKKLAQAKAEQRELIKNARMQNVTERTMNYEGLEDWPREKKELEHQVRALEESLRRLKDTNKIEIAATSYIEKYEAKVEELNNTLRLLQQKLNDKDNIIYELEAKNLRYSQNFNKEVVGYEESIKKLQREREELVLSLREDKEELVELNRKLEELSNVLKNKELELFKVKRDGTEIKMSYEKAISDLQEQLKQCTEEFKHKDYTRELQYQSEVSAIKSAYSLELAKHNEEWEELCEERIRETKQKLEAEQALILKRVEETERTYKQRINELENTTIPLKEHYQKIEEVKEKCENEKEEETKRIRSVMQVNSKEITNNLNALKEEHKKALQNTEEQYKKKVKELEESLDEMLKKKESVELSNQKLMKENTKMKEEIEECQEDFKKELEKGKEKRKELEESLQVTKNTITNLELDKRDYLKYSTDNPHLKELESLKEEKYELTSKCKALENEIVDHTDKLRRQLQERNMEVETFNRAKEDLQREIDNLHKSLQETREHDNKLIEAENNKYAKLKTEYYEQEANLKKLEMKYDKLILDMQQLNKYKEDSDIKIAEGNKQKASMEQDIDKLKEQYENLDELYEEQKERLSRTMNALRVELRKKCKNMNSLLSELSVYFEESKQLFENRLREIGRQVVKYYNNAIKKKEERNKLAINRLEDEYNEIIKNKSEEERLNESKKEIEYESKYKTLTQQKDIEINNHQTLIHGLESKLQLMSNNMNDLEEKLRQSELNKKELEEINKALSKTIKERIEGFDTYKKSTETSYKEHIDQLISTRTKEVSELNETHNSKLNQLYNEVNDIKQYSVNTIKRLLNDISLLRTKHQEEVAQVTKDYEKGMEEVISKFKEEQEMARRLMEQLEKISLELYRARQEQRSIQINSDEKFDMLNSSSLKHSEKYKQLKLESKNTIDVLQDEIKRLRIELTNKDVRSSSLPHKETFFPSSREERVREEIDRSRHYTTTHI